MANTTSSANMSLPIPVVGVDPGPDYADNLNSCLSIIDAHNHTPGSGVQIPSSGLNINADLTFGGNNATALKSARFTAQGSPLSGGSDLGCIYVSGVDLYYNDENANRIQITQSGAVAGTPGSISGLVSPASASYSSGPGTFIFRSAASTSGNIDGGSLIIREQIASANGITISSPTSLGANYTLTLMGALPGSNKFLSIDSSGNIASTWAVDNSTITITANVIAVPTSGITSTQLAANSVTQAKLQVRATGSTVAAGGVAISSGSSTFSTGSATPVDITNLSVTITTTGRPVMVFVQSDAAAAAGSNLAYIGAGTAAPGQHGSAFYYIKNGSTIIAITTVDATTNSNAQILIPPDVRCLDFPVAGTYTYKAQVALATGTVAYAFNSVLVAYET